MDRAKQVCSIQLQQRGNWSSSRGFYVEVLGGWGVSFEIRGYSVCSNVGRRFEDKFGDSGFQTVVLGLCRSMVAFLSRLAFSDLYFSKCSG